MSQAQKKIPLSESPVTDEKKPVDTFLPAREQICLPLAGLPEVEAIAPCPNLTTTEAYEIAVTRGYPSTRNSFKDWTARRPDRCEAEYGIRRFPGRRSGKNELLFLDLRNAI